jgi:hypothetical protein
MYDARCTMYEIPYIKNPLSDFGFYILDAGLPLFSNPTSKIQNGETYRDATISYIAHLASYIEYLIIV